MIFTDAPLTDKLITVRFYNYSDPNMGWGDAGAQEYVMLPLNAFVMEEHKRFKEEDGPYYTYKLTENWYKRFQKHFGECWHMGIGYELENKEKRAAEIEKFLAAIKAETETTNLI